MIHTPGPWSYACVYDDGATLQAPHVELLANARLIAAAPDLLEALKLAQWCPTTNQCPACGQKDVERHNAVCRIGLAIAKAEGR